MAELTLYNFNIDNTKINITSLLCWQIMDRLGQIRLQLQSLWTNKTLVETLGQTLLAKWDSMPKRKQYLVLINKTVWPQLYFEMFQQIFPEKNLLDTPETHKVLKNLVTDLEPWSPDNDIKMTKCIDTFLERETIRSTPVDYLAFQVFGCVTSRDIDIAILVRSHLELTENINIHRLHAELTELGYDISRGIDLNVLYSNNGTVMACTRGSTEIQNMLYATYDLHPQKYPRFVSGLTPVDKEDKISATAKFILDNLKTLICETKYVKERLNKRAAYAGRWNRVTYVLSILHLIRVTDTNDSRECFKSLTMKIIQIILLEKNEFEYQKYELARKLDMIFPGHYQSALWLLTRGIKGFYNPDTVDLLLSELHRIALTVTIIEPTWTRLSIDLTHNPTHLQYETFREFIKSPLKPTDKFVKDFKTICPDRSVNCFLINPHNTDLLPPDIKKRAICIPQRSLEWINLLTFYACGRNTGVKKYTEPDWVQYYYNLIRGAIVELMVIESCDFTPLIPNYEKITVGFLVEEVGRAGCLGIAPDLLLLVNGITSVDIIPVEIKCLTGTMSDNHDYRRDIELATKQLESSIKLTGSQSGIIVLVYVNDTGFEVHGTVLNF